MHDAKAQAELVKRHSIAVAIGYVILTQPHDLQHEHVKVLVHTINATVQQLDKSTYKLFSTRGDIKAMFDSNQFRDLISISPDPIFVGFGYGVATA